jgi:hypothetical protein
MNLNFYINVNDEMKEEYSSPKCILPKPTPKSEPTLIVNHGERLPIISVECDV